MKGSLSPWAHYLMYFTSCPGEYASTKAISSAPVVTLWRLFRELCLSENTIPRPKVKEVNESLAVAVCFDVLSTLYGAKPLEVWTLFGGLVTQTVERDKGVIKIGKSRWWEWDASVGL